jgi:hypothetical protein
MMKRTMLRTLTVLLALLSLTGAANSNTTPRTAAAVHSALFTPVHTDNHFLRSLAASGSAHSTPTALACCKVCSAGKACGNTCISRDKTCHVGQGCACDG